ncbi:MAG: 3-dehydroquinate synthase [Proteobacteria bacterium]|nr:3-dehydroquinate synthase [Pseudomonadota bacterium]MBU1449665.1 3-dehydroquinate synthase [Pseudomonadota bacterium]MBU2469920.1 3-dehydroquinate synthase [Pseudomonadota bacterium]MBU2516918.1 3-dehydroquinate synthase [Pseudomonadota bacterium]
MSGNIYLTGFMGAGKSTVGRLLAQALGRRLVSLDQRIVRRLRQPVTEAFARRGEEVFRQVESEELARVAGEKGLVVDLGGGAAVSEHNRELMHASGGIVHLAAGLDTCRKRLGPHEVSTRPLWRDKKAVERLFKARQEAYADCGLRVEVDQLDAGQAAQAVAAGLLGVEEFTLEMEGKPCLVHSSWGAQAALAEATEGRRVVLLTDRKVAALHGARYREALGDHLLITLPPGENSKSLKTAEKVYQQMLAARIERGDMLLALGGGVMTDLGAFVAATYKRGMDFLLASTTLLGCVDAAVGGKAAVNLGPAKNQVGCFTQPRMVLLDLQALATLPKSQRVEGLAEAYKTGLVADPELARLCQQDMDLFLKGEVLGLAQVVRRSVRAKAEVVGQDFREGGRRAILNFGHTYGHALEGWHRYRLGHGQAVGGGMLVATALSAGRGMLTQEQAESIYRTVKPLLPADLAWAPAEEAWEIMLDDKKNIKGKVRFVLLKEVGQPVVVDDVTPQELAQALAQAREI